ncbi:MAG: hypothetical protein H6936_10315 [Burkholderiales bacterium]|nr:hypothetical protein [Nitrosomonas sp.]MCP5275221.1 hypothetical protein [Burkholderiales bacterium]
MTRTKSAPSSVRQLSARKPIYDTQICQMDKSVTGARLEQSGITIDPYLQWLFVRLVSLTLSFMTPSRPP